MVLYKCFGLFFVVEIVVIFELVYICFSVMLIDIYRLIGNNIFSVISIL